jgi:hypothetical protein
MGKRSQCDAVAVFVVPWEGRRTFTYPAFQCTKGANHNGRHVTPKAFVSIGKSRHKTTLGIVTRADLLETRTWNDPKAAQILRILTGTPPPKIWCTCSRCRRAKKKLDEAIRYAASLTQP